MREKEFTVWHEGQTESDGKIIKAPNADAAAKKAVDIWRHEQGVELGEDKVTVHVREFSGERSYTIVVSHSGNKDAPEAFL